MSASSAFVAAKRVGAWLLVAASVAAAVVMVPGWAQAAGVTPLQSVRLFRPLPGAAIATTASVRRAPMGTFAPPRRQAFKVGSVLVRPCRASGRAWCATIAVPYDYSNPAAGTIRLGFEWYPATSGHAVGTILAVQGGPGYATTDYAEQYRGVFGSGLLARRNLLLVDLRGTGRSSPFTCRALQNWTLNDSVAAYIVATGACGRQLNHTRRLKGGRGYVQASDLYTTANAARDVARLLGRLRTGPVDFYGDSYGTFFGQVFAARFHRLLRSVTLDSAYPVSQSNAFYPATIKTARYAFNVSCQRSVACHRAAPGSSWTSIATAAAYLRAHPVTGRTRTPYGRVIRDTVGVDQLIELVNIAGSDSGVYRELDPALRAFQKSHDRTPLLRLAAQEIDQTATSGPVRQFNAGLYEATTCLDYPQPFRYRSRFPARRRQYERAVDSLRGHEFAPFTIKEWVTEPAEEFDSCLEWPKPRKRSPPITTPPPYVPSTVPVLVLSGDLDSLTTPSQGRTAARNMSPRARWILIRNDTHINAMDDTFGCASGLVRQFVAAPRRLWQLNASCARRTPEVRVVGTFPERVSAVTPATPLPGNTTGTAGLRLAAVAAAATGDAVWHWYYGDGLHGWGLRGGTCAFSGTPRRTRITFHDIVWAYGTTVKGRALWNRQAGFIRATLRVRGPGGIATVALSYHDYVHHPAVAVAGHYRGRVIRATMPAP